MPSPSELLSGGEPRWPRTYDGDASSGQRGWSLWSDPAFIKCSIDNLDLDLLDSDWWLIDANHASRFTGSRAQPASEFREIVCGVEAFDGLAPMITVDKVVPIRNEIAERAAVVTERDAAVHASTGLGTDLVCWKFLVDLFPVTKSNWNRSAFRQLPFPLKETCCFTHERPP